MDVGAARLAHRVRGPILQLPAGGVAAACVRPRTWPAAEFTCAPRPRPSLAFWVGLAAVWRACGDRRGRLLGLLRQVLDLLWALDTTPFACSPVSAANCACWPASAMASLAFSVCALALDVTDSASERALSAALLRRIGHPVRSRHAHRTSPPQPFAVQPGAPCSLGAGTVMVYRAIHSADTHDYTAPPADGPRKGAGGARQYPQHMSETDVNQPAQPAQPAQPRQLPIDARVHGTDGELGRLTDVIINPARRTLTHVVVAEDDLAGREFLVPVEHIVQTDRETVRLDCSRDDLRRFQEFYATRYVSPESPEAQPVIQAPWESNVDLAFLSSGPYPMYYPPSRTSSRGGTSRSPTSASPPARRRSSAARGCSPATARTWARSRSSSSPPGTTPSPTSSSAGDAWSTARSPCRSRRWPPTAEGDVFLKLTPRRRWSACRRCRCAGTTSGRASLTGDDGKLGLLRLRHARAGRSRR